jgi:hypothetical protein
MATRIQPRRHELLEKSSSPGRLDLLEFWQPTQAAVCASYSDRLELLGFGNKTQAAVSASYSDDKLDLLRFGNKYLLVLFVTLSIAHGAFTYRKHALYLARRPVLASELPANHQEIDAVGLKSRLCVHVESFMVDSHISYFLIEKYNYNVI